MKKSKRKMRKIKKRDKDKMTEVAIPKTLKDYEKVFGVNKEEIEKEIEDLRVDSDKEIETEDLRVDSDKVFEGGAINNFELGDNVEEVKMVINEEAFGEINSQVNKIKKLKVQRNIFIALFFLLLFLLVK